jgi:hypothetical protein
MMTVRLSAVFDAAVFFPLLLLLVLVLVLLLLCGAILPITTLVIPTRA